MADYIVMPKLGFDMQEGVLNTWLKSVGDTISKGEVVAEIESDKATLELESQVAGVLLHTLHAPGDVVPIGANMAIVGKEGEDVTALIGSNGKAAQPASAETPAAAVAQSERVTEPAQAADAEPVAPRTEVQQGAVPDESYPDGVKATPVARQICSACKEPDRKAAYARQM
jgi:pyruvate dehydrogenase E2 component (dihydrolipoamide acetyltransferase)